MLSLINRGTEHPIELVYSAPALGVVAALQGLGPWKHSHCKYVAENTAKVPVE